MVSGSTPPVAIPGALIPDEEPSGVRPKAKPKPHQCPEDWQPSAAVLTWAVETAGITKATALSLVDGFVDHWHAGKGHKEKRPGWDASFRTWVRTALERGDVTIADPDDMPDPPSRSATHDPVTGIPYADLPPGRLSPAFLERLQKGTDEMFAPSWAKGGEPESTEERWVPKAKATP